MAAKWNEVTASPQYQALPPEEQQKLKDRFFNNVVAASSQFQQLDPEAQAQLKNRFYDTTPKPATGADIPGAAPATGGGIADTVQKVFTAAGTPFRGFRAMGVGVEKVLTGEEGDLTSAQGLKARGAEALQAASAATEPGYEPREGEKLGAFVGESLPTVVIPGVKVAQGVTKGAQAINAVATGALFGLGSSTAEKLADKGFVDANDAKEIAFRTGATAVFAGVANKVLGSIVERFSKGKVSATAPETPTVPPGIPATPKTPVIPDSPTAVQESLQMEALRPSLRQIAELDSREGYLTMEAKVNLSQLRDKARADLEQIRAMPQALAQLSERERQIAKELIPKQLPAGPQPAGLLPAPPVVEGPGFLMSPPQTSIPSRQIPTAQSPVGQIETFPKKALRDVRSGKLDSTIQEPAPPAPAKVKKAPKTAPVPPLSQVLQDIPKGSQIDPTVADVVDAARLELSGHGSPINIKAPTPETPNFGMELKTPPAFEKGLPNEAQMKIRRETAANPIVKESGIPPEMVMASKDLPGTDIAPALRPEIIAGTKSWKSGWWARLAVPTQQAISRMGVAGQQLASDIGVVRDVPVVRYGDFINQFDRFFVGLGKAEAQKVSQALADVLEGRPSDVKLPNGLLDFAQKALKTVGAEMESLGANVLRDSGEKVPFAPRGNYFPRVMRAEILDAIIANDGGTLGKLAQHLADSGQAESLNIAFSKVQQFRMRMMTRRFGHIERARELDLPPEFYDRNSLRVLPEYMRSALHRMEEIKAFGQNDELAAQKLAQIATEGHDVQLARQAYERFVGIEISDTVHSRGVNAIRNLTSAMLVQVPSTILQFGQVLTPAFEAGFVRAGVGFVRAFTKMGKEEAAKAGQIFNRAASEYLNEAFGGVGRGLSAKIADKSIKATGFAHLDGFLRKYSSIVGRDYVENSLVPKALKGSSAAMVELRNLGINPTALRRTGKLSEIEVDVAAKRFADQAQGSPDVTRLPLWWSSPTGRLFTQFKTFGYVIGRENFSLIKRAIQTGNVERMVGIPAGLIAAGTVIGEMRQKLFGLKDQPITGNPDTDKLINTVANATALGTAMDLFLSTLQGRDALTRTLMPASAKNFLDILFAATNAGDPKGQKQLVRKIPVVGRVLAQ